MNNWIIIFSHKVTSMSWPEINEKYSEKCPNILHLFDLILALPAASAVCERGFSAMKQLKTEYRNRMKSATMTSLLTIQLHSPYVDKFEPEPAILWWYKPNRRVSWMETFNLNEPNGMQVEYDEEGVNAEGDANVHANTEEPDSSDMDSDYDSEFSNSDAAMSLSDVCQDLDLP